MRGGTSERQGGVITISESAENSKPLLTRICMCCKIFSDDPEIATNQKIGLHNLPRTEWGGFSTLAMFAGRVAGWWCCLRSGCSMVSVSRTPRIDVDFMCAIDTRTCNLSSILGPASSQNRRPTSTCSVMKRKVFERWVFGQKDQIVEVASVTRFEGRPPYTRTCHDTFDPNQALEGQNCREAFWISGLDWLS